MLEQLKLPVAALKLTLDSADIAEMEPAPAQAGVIGQQRAQSALAFGIAMKSPGYNIYVMGDPGTGRLTLVNHYLAEYAARQETPPSHAYVDNFDNPREPVTLELPAGEAQHFSKDIEKLLENILATFPAAFESPSYQQKKTAIERRFSQRYNQALDLVDEKARELSVVMYRDSDVITFLPLRDDKALSEEQFTLLPQAERDAFHKNSAELEEYLGDALLELPQWRRAMVEEIRQLDNDTIRHALEPLFEELNAAYQNVDDIITYVAEIEKHLGRLISEHLMPNRPHEQGEFGLKRLLHEQYMPNILIDNKELSGAPVIYEPHPVYPNLFGRIEYLNDQGVLITNYRRICPGSLHRANGGYLILDAEKILTYPFVWEGLKRALKAGCVEIESPYSEFGLNTMTLKPEVIPLSVKVILIGSRDIYYLLEELDSEFNEMFRVLADFDDHIRRTPEHINQFASLMRRHARDASAKPLTDCALLRLIEHSCRLAEHQQQLSAHINSCLEIIAEANLLCGLNDAERISKLEIEQALVAREQRNGRIAEEVLDEMLEGAILIDTDGEAIGKVNGLTVMDIGGSRFGAPARITATVHPGSRGIVDIEREAELGQAIHSKGVMILTGYLGHCYAQQFPLAISASIAMEQSYGHIDGDSASLAELCCLISALTHVPIRQGFALTGSINQYGEVQAIGGVNEKIEGFFNLCAARGLTGRQAVIIPCSNVRNLMLKQEVIDAVRQDRFAIYAVSNVNQTLSLLMDRPAGEIDAEGAYPENSVNFKAVARLKEISDIAAEEREGA